MTNRNRFSIPSYVYVHQSYLHQCNHPRKIVLLIFFCKKLLLEQMDMLPILSLHQHCNFF